MRPQLFAAEIKESSQTKEAQEWNFNEAAAIRCGDPIYPAYVPFLQSTSMRPQLFAAEIRLPDLAAAIIRHDFNEAAAIRCGDLIRMRSRIGQSTALQ